jgi:general nucleoside transport system permease protein
MATSSPTFDAPPIERRNWRNQIRLTRTNVFSALFILAGLWILWSVPRNYAADVTTTLTFGENVPELVIPLVGYMILVALLYLAGGAVGLTPNPALSRLKFWLLLLNGILILPTVLIVAAAGERTNAITMLEATLRLATPIVMGALAGIWCERSGVTNIAIEGMMLTGACFGFVAFSLLAPLMPTPGAQLLGVLAAVLSGGIISLLHSWLSITFRTNQIVSGTVINILAIGVTSYIRREVLLSSEAGRETLQPIPIPFLSDLPIVGQTIFSGRPIFYSMFILLIVTHVVLFYTRWGLRTRAVGENPHAADTLGIDVIRNRWINVFIGGLIAGLAGAWFSLETTGSFDDQMTSGRGFIALAAMIFGKWLPFGAFGGGMLFGFSSALETRFQILGVDIPPQFLQMTPYLVTMIVLAGLVGKATPPKADGIPYEKE